MDAGPMSQTAEKSRKRTGASGTSASKPTPLSVTGEPKSGKRDDRKGTTPARRDGDRSLLGSEHLENLDRTVNAMTSRFTGGISPVSIAMEYFDWLAHLAVSPGKQARLTEKAVRKAFRVRTVCTDMCNDRAGTRRCASSRCPRTDVSPTRHGSAFLTTSSTRRSCSTSSGGTTLRRGSGASPSTTKKPCPSSPGSCSTCGRPRTSRSSILRSYEATA